MKTYDVTVRRDGKWWMIEIPEIGGLTQARRLGDVEHMARSFIAVDQDLAPSSFDVAEPRVLVAGSDLAPAKRDLVELRATAKRVDEQVAELMARTARKLAKADVPLRDIGAVLDVSHQRVHQLLRTDVSAKRAPRRNKGDALAEREVGRRSVRTH